ncbi:hypothetical protein AAG570_011667 [Ranatra chinensis]|uniref:Reverse transcriptase domain-containing protein n=1 Tax=Ranatra chinensis TaxID=642074 RepID=A0ABD0YH00_9HEMI
MAIARQKPVTLPRVEDAFRGPRASPVYLRREVGGRHWAHAPPLSMARGGEGFSRHSFTPAPSGVHKEAAERKGFEEEKVKSRVKQTMEAAGHSPQIIPHTQFGFRHQHSTVDQLSRVVSNITEQMSKGQSAALVILDSEKAFDFLWKEGLVYKLMVSGISTPMSKLIHSFLTNRKIRVKVERETSECATIPAGVRQGSVLSPTVFNLYTSDILSASIKGVQMAAFAAFGFILPQSIAQEVTKQILGRAQSDELCCCEQQFERVGGEGCGQS